MTAITRSVTDTAGLADSVAVEAPNRDCPSCGGSWLYEFTWRHTLACPLGQAQDATKAADVEALRYDPAGGVRDTTDAEKILAALFGWVQGPEPPVTTVWGWTESVLHLEVDGVAPPQVLTGGVVTQ
jgi:hypothetical protein